MRKKIALLTSLLVLTGVSATNFIDLGAPSPDHDWYGADMEAMAGVLKRPDIALPKERDSASARYFARVVDPANFSFYQNTHLPIEARISDFLKFQGAARDILLRYASDANRGIDLHHEVALLMCHLLFTSKQGIALVDEFVPTLQKDQTYGVRMDGLKQVKHALVLAFSASEQSLSETKFYDENDLSALLRAMDDCLPSLLPSFSGEDRKEFAKKLEARLASFTSMSDKGAIQKMITALREGPNPSP